ncbi:MAG: class I SAM-dependent methyltransferase [Candidatus Brockarchaeota archaeon]|nr:class I SAM-dependent methyltransferase [Candidatus Brockarchaeota archaeon]
MISYDEALRRSGPRFKALLEKIPKKGFERLPPDWLHWQILERLTILKYADIVEGSNVLEVGSGPHAIATIALAELVGERGRVVAVERGRWGDSWEVLKHSGLSPRVIPLQEDASKLPFPFSCFDLAVCVHGIRSFDGRQSIVGAVKEMLRVSKERVFLAESSPFAKNKAQEAHLAMYNLRRPTFLALGRADWGDLRYLPPQELRNIAIEAGASRVELREVDVGMPHHLACFPSDLILKVEDSEIRENLMERWRKALAMLERYGEEHPPVIVLDAWK